MAYSVIKAVWCEQDSWLRPLFFHLSAPSPTSLLLLHPSLHLYTSLIPPSISFSFSGSVWGLVFSHNSTLLTTPAWPCYCFVCGVVAHIRVRGAIGHRARVQALILTTPHPAPDSGSALACPAPLHLTQLLALLTSLTRPSQTPPAFVSPHLSST